MSVQSNDSSGNGSESRGRSRSVEQLHPMRLATPTPSPLTNNNTASSGGTSGRSRSSSSSRLHRYRSRTPQPDILNTPSTTASSGSSTPHTTHTAESNYVMALCEFRSRQQVGLVAMDPNQRTLILCQYGDNQTYATTAMWVAHFMPTEILVPDKMIDSPLVNRIHEEFPQLIEVAGIRRRYFNESSGLIAIQKVATTESLNLLNLDSTKYLCVSAANCLLKYHEFSYQMSFAPRSLKVQFQNLDGRVALDLRAQNNLELLPSYTPGEAATIEIMNEMSFLRDQPSGISRMNANLGDRLVSRSMSDRRAHRKRSNKMSLFDIFNCRTAMGARALRNSLLQPFNDLDTLTTRLDMVELFLLDEETYFALCELLPQFTDLDHISANMVQIPTVPTIQKTQRQIQVILTLGATLNLLPKLRESLMNLIKEARTIERRAKQAIEQQKKHQPEQSQSASESTTSSASSVTSESKSMSDDELPDSNSSSMIRLLSALIDNLDSHHYHTLQSVITSVMDLQKASQLHKSNVQFARYKFIFAVKSGLFGLLDVARRTFLEAVDELERERDRLASSLGFEKDQLQLTYTAARGYHLIISTDALHQLKSHEQNMFIQQHIKGRRTYCTTETFISLDTRQSEAFQEIGTMSARAIEEVLVKIRERSLNNIEWLAQVAESLAWLDLTLTFADLISRSPHPWVRPEFTMNGGMHIKEGRHPLLQETRQETIVPNDANISHDSNFRVVTGANGSGKSTYLRMIGVVNILAHIGCFVPATEATIRLTDQIFTRMSCEESNTRDDSSTFKSECQELAYILKNAKDRSLVLIDELGRATSSLDGVGICWSASEALLQRANCFTFLVTHFIELCQLPHFYPHVMNLHLQIDSTRNRASGTAHPGGSHLKYLYKVVSGQLSDELDEYGIQLAEMAAFPADLIADARRMQQELKQFIRQQQAHSHKKKRPASTTSGASSDSASVTPVPGIVPSTLVPPTPTSNSTPSSTSTPSLTPLQLLKRRFMEGTINQLTPTTNGTK